MRPQITARLLLAVAFGLAAVPALAEDQPAPITVIIKDHRFVPSEIHVPAGQPALVLVLNQDGSAEEVESGPLKIEKVVPAGAQSRIRLRALEPGRYSFIGEYHPDTAQGVVIAE